MTLPKKSLAEWMTILIAVLSLLVSLYIERTHTDAQDHEKAMANEHRITSVENKVDGQRQQVDHIQSQVDKLVDWALGKQ